MEFVVKIEDNWIENIYIVDEIKHQIIQSLSKQITENLLEGHVRLVGEIASKKVIESFDAMANKATADFIETGKLKSSRSSAMISVAEYIAEKFEYNSNYNSQKELIEKLANNYSVEMKNRYDMMFASQLVIKMSEQGLLKEGVFDSLMKKDE
jgi:glucose-6-phosphate 1-dehydrogenase